MGWLYVPGLEGLNSGSSEPLPGTERSAGWNGNSVRRASLLRAWRTAPWLRRLSGMTCEPSTAQRGVEAWISSLRASRASPGALPGSGREQTTIAGSGRTSPDAFARWNPATCSWRTSAASFPGMEDLAPCSVTWPAWGSMRNGACYPRRKSAHRTSASGSSSWPTPDTQNDRDGTVLRAEQKGSHALSLHHAVAMWPTAQAHDVRRPGSDASSTQGANLKRDAEQWATPSAREVKGAYREEALTRKDGKSRMDLLGNQAAYFRPAPESESDGPSSSPDTPSSPRRLNPLFVEWLMGWPHGWTSAEPRGCGCWETGWCRSRPRQPSESLQGVSHD